MGHNKSSALSHSVLSGSVRDALMPKIRTADEFASLTTSSLTWRIREISHIKLMIRTAEAHVRESALRAGVPILYAHWEGHTVYVARCYVDFIATRRLRYAALTPGLRLNHIFPVFRKMYHTRLSYSEQIKMIKFILDTGDERLSQREPDIIDAKANLSSEVLKDLCALMSFDYTLFAADSDFIDKILLHRRNMIAHGEQSSVGEAEFDSMATRVIDLMRAFQNEADNRVQLGRYAVAAAWAISRSEVGSRTRILRRWQFDDRLT